MEIQEYESLLVEHRKGARRHSFVILVSLQSKFPLLLLGLELHAVSTGTSDMFCRISNTAYYNLHTANIVLEWDGVGDICNFLNKG